MYASAKERIILGSLLRSPESISKNNQGIYDALSRLTVQQLQSKRQNRPDVLGGWISLTLLFKTATKDQWNSEVNQWQSEYPRHPANGVFIANILSANQMDITASQPPGGKVSLDKTKSVAPGSSQITTMATLPITPFVAVMLPLTGPYAPAAQAIKTGIEAAYFADTRASKLKLHFVDTQSSDVHEIYRRLVDGGAVSIIGPLVKEDVAKLANSSDINVAVLALNQVQGASNANLFQFGLTPEHEVEQAAGSAWFDGRQNALVLAPDSSFGQRMVKHFSAYWKSLGGRVITVKTYAHHGSEFSSTVNGLLTGISPVDPGGANFVFLIADAHDARLIMPQLKITTGESFPVYALSHVYSGKTSVSLDQDLSGIVFCDVPWLLNPNEGGNLSVQMLESQIEKTPPEYVKLIAMGLDAYRLGSELERFRSDPLYRFNGQTGNLALLSGNRFQRQLECAQFENGKLQVRGQAPILEQTTPPVNYSH
jgi:outer membrane PBP1 activator LpoA protein